MVLVRHADLQVLLMRETSGTSQQEPLSVLADSTRLGQKWRKLKGQLYF